MHQARQCDEQELERINLEQQSVIDNEKEVKERNKRVWDTQVKIRKETEQVEQMF